MGNKRQILGICAFLAMLVLILDGKTALSGAYDGVLLCIKTVIPSLFPFFVLSNVIMCALMGMDIPILRPIGKICGIPAGMESILIPAFLGGYPVGAQTISQGWQQGQIPQEEAKRLMAFCNNAGPSFLFGMIASLFPSTLAAWTLWGIHITAALITAQLFPSQCEYAGRLPVKRTPVSEVLRSSLNIMGMVCGWIVLFRILIAFLSRWCLWFFSVPVKVVIIGMLELSNGCMALFEVDDLRLRFVICAGILAMGGLCVGMQTVSAAKGLSLKSYFRGKVIQTILSILLSIGLAYRKPWLWLIPLGFLVVFLRKPRKNGSIPIKAGV